MSSITISSRCYFDVCLCVLQIAAGLGFDMASLINNPAFISMVGVQHTVCFCEIKAWLFLRHNRASLFNKLTICPRDSSLMLPSRLWQVSPDIFLN